MKKQIYYETRLSQKRGIIIVKELNKNLSGKSDEIDVKKRKSRFFTLHSSFLILRKHSFHTAKGKL